MKSVIKAIIKFFITYTIEGDERVFAFMHTPFAVRVPISKRAFQKYGSLPIIPNKIIFDNYMGRGFGCNCRYVTEELLKRNLDVDIVWAVKKENISAGMFPQNVRLVEYGSEEALKEYYTAGIWVCNYHLIAYFNRGLVKRTGQCYIQMWHGSLGIKKIEKDCDCLTVDQPWKILAMKNAQSTDVWISNSTFETEVYRHGFWDVNNVLMLGHPRNDIFFRQDQDAISGRVKEKLNLAKEDKILLYVPTFREDGTFPDCRIHVSKLLDVCERRFGGTIKFLLRRHPRMIKNKMDICVDEQHQIIDATSYPDIQELLKAAFMVITDYSSCIFDFMLTRRPGFIFAPDIDKYNDTRGFYYPLQDTPFPIANDMDALCSIISDFKEEQYKKDVDAFLQEKGCIDDGNAAFRVCDYIQKCLP